MNSNQNTQPPVGRIIGITVLAVVLGLLMPVVTMVQVMSLCPVILLGGMLAVVFQCAAGWVPAGAFLAAQLISTALLSGPTMMAMGALAGVLPAVALLPGMHRCRPFQDQLRRALLLYFAGMLAAVGVAYASFGGGMIQQFMDVMRRHFQHLPDAALAPFVETVNAALSSEGLSGLQGMTVADYRASLMGMLDLMQQTYGRLLPGALLSGALVTAVLTVLWGNWRLALRGGATAHSFVGMSRWRLPAQVIVGMLILWAVSFALAQGGIASGAAVYDTVHQLVCHTFLFQALAAMDRRYISRGMPMRRRRVILGVSLGMALVFRDIAVLLMVVGIVSALFGSGGLITRHVRDDDDDKDDSDPDDPDFRR